MGEYDPDTQDAEDEEPLEREKGPWTEDDLGTFVWIVMDSGTRFLDKIVVVNFHGVELYGPRFELGTILARVKHCMRREEAQEEWRTQVESMCDYEDDGTDSTDSTG